MVGALDDFLPGAPARRLLAAPAPPVTAAVPEVDVPEDRVARADRTLRLRIHSPRGAPTMRLFVQGEAKVRRATVAGTVQDYPVRVRSCWVKASAVTTAGWT